MESNISRRDFVGGTLVGLGASLISSKAQLHAASQSTVSLPVDPWTGYGGVGDYAISNGNVATVRDSAHFMRDIDIQAAMVSDAKEINEEYDMVIIGGGFSGLGAAFNSVILNSQAI